MVLAVHDGQLLNLVAAEDLTGLLEGGALGSGDQVVLGHHVVNELRHVGLKLHITVGDDTNELAVVADGHTGDAVLRHQLVCLSQGVAWAEEEGVGDNAVLTALDHVHLLGLSADGHILVDDTQTAFPGQGDGHPGLGDRVHGGAHHRDIQGDLAGETGVQVDVCGEHVALGRNQQHVVEGQTHFYKFVIVLNLRHFTTPPKLY